MALFLSVVSWAHAPLMTHADGYWCKARLSASNGTMHRPENVGAADTE